MTVYSEDLGTYTPDELVADGNGLVTSEGVITGSAAFVRGTVMGRITADGNFLVSLSAAIDGSEVPDCILAEDVDATAADKTGALYKSGKFVESSLTIGTAHTADTIRQGLRERGIFLHKAV